VYKHLSFTTGSSASQLAHQSLILSSSEFPSQLISTCLSLSQLVSIYLSFLASHLISDYHFIPASSPHGSPWDLTIRDHYKWPKGGFKFRSSWLTMRPHDPWSLRPTERWLQLQVLMAHHEISRSVIIMTN